jgi:hypothetical protein
LFNTTKPTKSTLGINPGLCGEKPATNILKYGTACSIIKQPTNLSATEHNAVGVRTLWSPWIARHTTNCHSQGQFYFSADIQQAGAATGTNRLAAIAFTGCLTEDKYTIHIALKFARLYVDPGRRRFFAMR